MVADTSPQMVVVAAAMSVVAVAVVAAAAVFLTVAAPVAVAVVAVAAELQMCLVDGHVCSPCGYASCADVCPPCGCVGSSSSARLRCRCRCHLPSGVPTRAASARSSDLQRSRHLRPCGATLRRCRRASVCSVIVIGGHSRGKGRKANTDRRNDPSRHVFTVIHSHSSQFAPSSFPPVARKVRRGRARAPGRRTVLPARTRPRLMHSGSSIALACTPLRPRQPAPRGYLMKKGGRSDDADDQPRPMHIKQLSCEGWKVYRNRFVIELSPYHNVIGVRRHPTAQPRGCPLITCSHSLYGHAPPQWERTAPERATSSRASSSCSSTSHRI